MIFRCRYAFVYIFLLKDLAVIAADIYTATTMIASSTWTNVIYKKCGNDCAIKIPFDVAKWVFVGCIIFGFLLVSGLTDDVACSKRLMLRRFSDWMGKLEGKKSHSEQRYRFRIYQCHGQRLSFP